MIEMSKYLLIDFMPNSETFLSGNNQTDTYTIRFYYANVMGSGYNASICIL
jgi:hypothetical protein